MEILLIDNRQKTVDLIKRGLEANRYNVDVSFNGKDGLRQAVTGSYNLIILNKMLPRKGEGLSVIRELRAENVLTPILMLTANSVVEDIVEGFNAGADDFLSAPFDVADLLARIEALRHRSERERGAVLRFADLRLDPLTREVWRNNTEIILTPKEYSLLEFFMRNPNKVLSRATIADSVWVKNPLDRFTNTVDVYINYLRKKLHRGTGKKLIHSIRRTGYILMEEI